MISKIGTKLHIPAKPGAIMESTYGMIKPNSSTNGDAHKIIAKINSVEPPLRVTQMGTSNKLSKEVADAHYEEHVGKSWYEDKDQGLRKFIQSGPVVKLKIEGLDAVKRFRELVGATDPAEAAEHTIRKEFGVSKQANSCHASDSPESAKREIGIHFPYLKG